MIWYLESRQSNLIKIAKFTLGGFPWRYSKFSKEVKIEAWEKDYNEVKEQLSLFDEYRGKINSAKNLLDFKIKIITF